MTERRWQQRILGAIVGVFFIGLAIYLLRGPLLRVVSLFARPLAFSASWISDQAIGVCQNVTGTPQNYEEERQALAIDRTELERLRDENAQLRDQLGFVARQNERVLSAAVISRASTSRASRFVIDRGSSDGVTVGSPVIVGDGMLVGKVLSMSPTTATVIATTDPESAAAATLLNKTRTLGITQGTTGTLMTMQYIPNDETVHVNDLVVTSGLEESMPSGLVIGIVNAVTSDPTAPFQSAIVEPLVDMRRYSSVSVLVTL